MLITFKNDGAKEAQIAAALLSTPLPGATAAAVLTHFGISKCYNTGL